MDVEGGGQSSTARLFPPRHLPIPVHFQILVDFSPLFSFPELLRESEREEGQSLKDSIRPAVAGLPLRAVPGGCFSAGRTGVRGRPSQRPGCFRIPLKLLFPPSPPVPPASYIDLR